MLLRAFHILYYKTLMLFTWVSRPQGTTLQPESINQEGMKPVSIILNHPVVLVYRDAWHGLAFPWALVLVAWSSSEISLHLCQQ